MPDRLKALVYRPGSLGDTVVALPAIAELRRRFPAHHLTLLTERTPPHSARVSPWTILGETGWFDAVCFYSVHPATWRDRGGNLSIALKLRVAGFDRIFSLAPPRTARQLKTDAMIFQRLVGTRHYHAADEPSWPVPAGDAESQHESLRLLRIIDSSAADDSHLAFRLPVPNRERVISGQLLDQLGIGADDVLVGVAPGSARSTTTWPAERFAAVGQALLRRFRHVTLLAFGGANEQTLCEQLCEAWGPRSRNLAGRLSVLGSASVLSRCATFIGNDSGPTHLAAMVGIPCVAISSARNAVGQWTPLGRHHVVLEERPECAGCMLDECVVQARKCLLRIPIGRVVREASSLIESRACYAAHQA